MSLYTVWASCTRAAWMRLSLASKRSVVFLWVAPSNYEWSLSGVTSLSIKTRYLLEFHLQQVKLSLILVVVEIQTHQLVKYIKGPVQHVNRQNLNSLPFAINIAFNTRFGTIPHLLGNHLLNSFLIGFVMFCTGPVCRWWSVSRTSHLVNWQFRSSPWYIYIGTSLI